MTEIVRVFDAPRERLWRAWTDPDELVRWWGKRGWTAQRDSLVLDVRPGGELRIVSVSDAGARDDQRRASGTRSSSPSGWPSGRRRAPASVVTFTDLGDGRTEMRFNTSTEMTGRAAAGFRSGLDRLAELLEPNQEPPMNITGVDFICMPTDDFEASVKFYEETLGLPRGKQWGEHPGMEFQAGNLTLAIMESTSSARSSSPTRCPSRFQVDDVAAAKAELEAKGVEFAGDIIDSGTCHQAIFKDPGGNALDLHHIYARR